MDPPYSETLYNSIIVFLEMVCYVISLATHHGLYVCILRHKFSLMANRVARSKHTSSSARSNIRFRTTTL